MPKNIAIYQTNTPGTSKHCVLSERFRDVIVIFGRDSHQREAAVRE